MRSALRTMRCALMWPLIVTQAAALTALSGVSLPLVASGEKIALSSALQEPGTSMLVFGTYPADFNMIEYCQKLAFYTPALQAKGVDRILCTVNGPKESCELLKDMLEIPDSVELVCDELGEAGRKFGVSTGWMPDNEDVSPYAKLLGMLVGFGAGNTLPSVITGYLGNPSGTNGWIEKALAQGQKSGRWPSAALDLDEKTGDVVRNAFDELPLVGSWGRRPLELATLRLQTMVGVSLARWSDLKPLDERCLTQLGGLVVVKDGAVVFEWRDNGICATADFEKVLQAL